MFDHSRFIFFYMLCKVAFCDVYLTIYFFFFYFIYLSFIFYSFFFFFSSRRRHTRFDCDWSSDVCSSDLGRSDAAFSGSAVAVPRGGYVRVYPFIGGLPAIPGRYYTASHVLCLYWHEPVSNCSRLSANGVTLLSPFVSLPLRHLAPTAPVAVRYRSRLLRHANGNIFAALG